MECRNPVRSLACTGPAAETGNLLLAGFADGVARLYNLSDLKRGSVPVGQCNQAAVTSVAFSPDGKLCLTAGEDRSIQVWEVEVNDGRPSVKQLHHLADAHRAGVTHVGFIPSSSPATTSFYSVGRDNRMTFWTMEGTHRPTTVEDQELAQRTGDVTVLGSDGKNVLVDQGSELRLHSLADRTQIEGRLRNPPGSANFTTLALFAPDGKTILTNCASEGRLQLWRTPPTTTKGRGSELRQLMWTTGVATCGAFAPQDRFVATGTQDQCVLVWDMPSNEEIDRRLEAKITFIEKGRESSSLQVRLWAELEPWTKLSEASLSKLREKVPEEVVRALTSLRDREFTSKDSMVKAMRQLKNDQVMQFEDEIVHHAETVRLPSWVLPGGTATMVIKTK